MAARLKIRQEPEARTGELVRLEVGSQRLGTEQVHAATQADGPEVRTCTHCGEHVAFRIDPLGSWAECPACGHLS